MRAAHITLFLILTQEFTFSLQNLKNQSFQTLFDKNLAYKKYKYDHLPEGLHDPNEKNGLSFELHCHCGVFKTLN